MRGYKVFNPDWTCRGFKFTVGETFEEDVVPSCCDRGFHFCKELKDCFSYYSFDPNNKVAEIEAVGGIDTETNDSKCCTNKIRIIRELTWEEVLRLVNIGNGNVGFCNSGDWNIGNRNIGNRNSGNRNSGDWNSGDWNSGNRNSGDCNSGNRNSGDCNSGDCNSGNRNSGDWNSGDCNIGNRNIGNRNSGDWNSGDCNSGNRNSGDWNSGDWNKTNFSNGCFNTAEPKIYLFNKPSEWTYCDWLNSKARCLLNHIPGDVLKYVRLENMTDEERAAHPEAETTGGYLKQFDESECGQIWWDNLSDCEKGVIKAMPNFDAEIFEQVTGIHIDLSEEERK